MIAARALAARRASSGDDDDEQTDEPRGPSMLSRGYSRGRSELSMRLVGNRRKIVTMLLVAFIVRLIAEYDMKAFMKGEKNPLQAITLNPNNLVAWGVLVAMLSIASDTETASDLAVAFALLIMFASLMVSGPQAMTNLLSIVNTSNKKPDKKDKDKEDADAP